MKRKPTDFTSQIQTIAEQRRQREAQEQEEKRREEALLSRQAQSYGEVVLDISERPLTIDVLTGQQLESQERLRANPALEQEWAARGAEYFRTANAQRKQPAGNKASGNGLSNGHLPNANSGTGDGRASAGQSPAAAASPPPARAAAPPRTADLLGGLAANSSGEGSQEEDERHGEQS